ncbi:hypothetical protein BC828DRAFT_394300 [Blastocladiella britannica]|nr:hypothetical protein BC828DRAFT_394300 [Blastocladiella britannica]
MAAVLIKQGAEARIFKHDYLGAIPAVTKERFSKSYRHPQLDAKLTKARLLQEARALHKARTLAGVRTPHVLFVDQASMSLTIEYIDAPTARDWVDAHHHASDLLDTLSAAIGSTVAKLHRVNIIHGDLTTSNLLVDELPLVDPATTPAPIAVSATAPAPSPPPPLEIVVIDFGLAETSTMVEDKGVDLYVLERAIRSTHPSVEKRMMHAILAAYETEAGADGRAVLRKLDEVRQRGRKRSMIG